MEKEKDFDYDIITLYDEDNNEIEYAVIDGVSYKDKMYLALVEAEHLNDEECEFLILRSDKDGEEDVLSSIDNEDEFNKVMELFDEKLEDYTLTVENEEN